MQQNSKKHFPLINSSYILSEILHEAMFLLTGNPQKLSMRKVMQYEDNLKLTKVERNLIKDCFKKSQLQKAVLSSSFKMFRS